MNVFNTYRDTIEKIVTDLSASGDLPADLPLDRISVEPPRDASHGDISTNVAMVLAKPAGMKPRDLADTISSRLAGVPGVAGVDVAGPGFVNLRLDGAFWQNQVVEILKTGIAYGDSTAGAGKQINIEYVSANPTGPMHVGHARGAVIGDVLASMLAKIGYEVTREYYINDAGAQVDVLARSAHLRYREALGEDIGEIPDGLYPGDYLVGVGKALAERDGDKWLSGAEEEREQYLFRSTQFGDDVDRPLKKSDGSWTYFAADVAYHLDKFQRGFAEMVDVWGADHKGYIKRMQAAVKATTDGKGVLDVRICNLVNLFEDGEPVRMSKRAGTFVTLREVVDQVGKDAVRFMMLTRGNEVSLDFDLKKVLDQSRDNPVFYVQYAHARACSVIRNALEAGSVDSVDDSSLAEADMSLLADEAELALIRMLAGWPRLVESAAQAREPHRIAYYLNDLAAEFHGLWNKGNDDVSLRFIIADDDALTRSRLALVRALAIVIASGLAVMGVQPVEEMR